MIVEIRALDPKPAAGFDAMPAQSVVPDLLMRSMPDGAWFIELNPETLPRVLVNERFYARVLPRAGKEDKAFLSERLASANWLVKSLQQRSQTILKVAVEIVRQQDAFFRRGVTHLRPLILRDIADAGGDAREHRQPGDGKQIHGDPARHLRTEVFLHHRDRGDPGWRCALRRGGAASDPRDGHRRTAGCGAVG